MALRMARVVVLADPLGERAAAAQPNPDARPERFAIAPTSTEIDLEPVPGPGDVALADDVAAGRELAPGGGDQRIAAAVVVVIHPLDDRVADATHVEDAGVDEAAAAPVPPVEALRREADVEPAVVVVVDERRRDRVAGEAEARVDRVQPAAPVGEQEDTAMAGGEDVEGAGVVEVAQRDLLHLLRGGHGPDPPPEPRRSTSRSAGRASSRRAATDAVRRAPPSDTRFRRPVARARG